MGRSTSHLGVTHPYLDVPTPVVLAHRGGAREAPENSLRAFRHAVSLGVTYIETDIRATADGVPVIFHDERLNRVTDRVGRIRDLPFAEVRKARVGNADRIHSLAEIMDHFPDVRFNIDVKEDNAVEPVIDFLRRGDHLDRLCVASFAWSRLRRIRAEYGSAVCTALAPQEVAALVSRSRLGRLSFASRFALPQGSMCVQVPPRSAGMKVVTRSLISLAHDREWPVHVWTVNDPQQMNDLLDLGVDGIITDRPTVARKVLAERVNRGA